MSVLPLTLLGSASEVAVTTGAASRLQLDECCWIDVVRSYLVGAERLIAELESSMVWHRGRRLMYGTWYDEPRLTATSASTVDDVPVAIDRIRDDLTRRYRRRFAGLFCNLYETGSDSVAWHAKHIVVSHTVPGNG